MSKFARISRRVLLRVLSLGALTTAALLTFTPPASATAGAAPVLTTTAVAEAPAWRVLESNSAGVRLELTLPALQRLDSRDGTSLLIPDGGEAGATGAPALPTTSHLVAVPAGARVTGAVLEWDRTEFAGLDLAPVREREDAPYTRDAAAYAASGWRTPALSHLEGRLPVSAEKAATEAAPLVLVGEPAVMAGLTMVPVTIAPVLYDAAAKTALVCGRVVLSLSYDIDAAKAAAPQRPLPRSFAALAAGQVLNLPREKTLPAGGAEPGLWVLVARNNATILSKLQPLIDWRKRQGYSVEILNADTAGNTNTGIKAALQAIYNDTARPPLEFVTLVGDAGGTYGVPTWNESLTSYHGEGDHYYAMLDGTDILADVHIGRLSFSNTTTSQLDVIVSKIVNYETNPPMADTSWYGRACLMGDPSASGITTIWVNQWLKTQLQGLGWSHVDTCWSGNFSTAMTTSLSPNGGTVFGYRGYLGMSGISAGTISAQTNGGKLPVALLPTCDTGSFASTDGCRSESWLRSTTGGGIAAVGTATTGTHTRYNNAYFMGAWDGLLNGADHRVGAGHTAGKLGMYKNYYAGEPAQAETWAVWNNLMGDPATDMWQGVPQPLTVTAPATLALGAGTIEVTVRSGFAPVPGLLVCALDAGGARLRGLTDSAGHVALAGTPPVAGTLKLTVSGHGFVPYLGNITVGQQAVYCGLTATQIIDDGTLGSVGNGDGQPNPGETLALVPTLTNTGTSAAAGVMATLSGDGTWVTVTQPALNFGAINAGQAVVTTAPAQVMINTETPDGEQLELPLVATSGAQTWISTIMLTVKAPAFTVTAHSFTGPGGNLDPGESGGLSLTLHNTGTLAAGNLFATLSTTSPWLSVTQELGGFGTIAAGASGTNNLQPFAIYVSPDCFQGHLAPCHLVLTSNGVMVAQADFTVTVGTLASTSPSGPDDYGYYAFDDTDIASGLAPIYDWVGIAPAEGGSGTSVGLSDFGDGQDNTKTVALPFAFRFYGKDFTDISICSNGWVSLGASSLVSYHNTGIPGAGGSPKALLAPFWDNLVQSGSNLVYQWYDAPGHRYIVEWHLLTNDFSAATQDFELILLDPAWHQTTSGEGMILFQYKTVNDTDSRDAYATIGIQSPDGRDGLLYKYWNQTMSGAAPVQTGRAILFMPLGHLLRPAITVMPNRLTVTVLPGEAVSRELQITNSGDEGSQLEVALSKVDPATVPGTAGGGVVTPFSIAGSTFTMDAVDYQPGATVVLQLSVPTVTAGQEWIRSLTLDTPPGVTVTASTAFTGGNGTIPSNNATGDGAAVVWSNGGYLNNGQTGVATMTVTYAAGQSADLTFAWTLQGDNYGQPPHTLNGTIVLPRTGPSIVVSAPAAGKVAVLDQPLTVTFTARNGPVNVSVELQREFGGPWETLAASTPAAAGSWTWPAVTGEPGAYALIRVRDVANAATEGLSGIFAVGRDLTWLQPGDVPPAIPAGTSATLNVTLDSAGLAVGQYEGLLVVAGNGGAPVSVPITFTVISSSAVDDQDLPTVVTLLGAVPNPFNPQTVIRFAVPSAQDARLEVYGIDGRLVRRLLDGPVAAGLHDVTWDGRDDAGRDAASGVYFHRLTCGGEVRTGKMVLAR
jgi:hypothetical protein